MARLIEDFGGPLPLEPDSRGRPADLYGALLRSITGQQLSVKAARAIYGRLIERFGGRAPTPEELLADDPEASCAPPPASRARRSPRCARWPSTCSPASCSWTRLDELPDDEVIRELVAVKGIGEWTAHMFLMFTLHRPDVLPTGDQGIKNAVHARLRARRGAQARRDDRDRRAVAPVPHAGVRLPLALARQRPSPEPRLFEVEVALDQPLDVLGDLALVAQPEHRRPLGLDQVAPHVPVAQPLLLAATSGAFSPPITATHWRKRAR